MSTSEPPSGRSVESARRQLDEDDLGLQPSSILSRVKLMPTFLARDPDRISYDALQVETAYGDRSELDWRGRLALMWRRDEYGSSSPELSMVTHGVTASAIGGFLIGGYIESKDVRQMDDRQFKL